MERATKLSNQHIMAQLTIDETRQETRRLQLERERHLFLADLERSGNAPTD